MLEILKPDTIVHVHGRDWDVVDIDCDGHTRLLLERACCGAGVAERCPEHSVD